jgi:hypothetical protein
MERSRRRPLLWLLAALVLFGLGAFLARGCAGSEEVARRPPPALPRHLRPAEARRMEQRQTLPPSAFPSDRSRPRDPVLTALAAPDAGTALVFEANALRNSPVGQLLLDCLEASRPRADGGASPLDSIRELGVDPLQDVDRVAVSDEGMVISGDFSRARWEAAFGGSAPTPYGAQGQLYRLPTADGGSGPVVAAWGGQLLVVAPDEASAQATVDRVEGRLPVGQVLRDDQAYGDVYGVLQGERLAGLFGPADGPLGGEVREVAKSVELHLDATRDVGLVANVKGDDPVRLTDLGKALGGALVAARARAVATGHSDDAELFEYARVVPGHETFSLEMAVPYEVLRARLAHCGRDPGTDGGR